MVSVICSQACSFPEDIRWLSSLAHPNIDSCDKVWQMLLICSVPMSLFQIHFWSALSGKEKRCAARNGFRVWKCSNKKYLGTRLQQKETHVLHPSSFQSSQGQGRDLGGGRWLIIPPENFMLCVCVSYSAVSDCVQFHGLKPARLEILQARILGWGAIHFSRGSS